MRYRILQARTVGHIAIVQVSLVASMSPVVIALDVVSIMLSRVTGGSRPSILGTQAAQILIGIVGRYSILRSCVRIAIASSGVRLTLI